MSPLNGGTCQDCYATIEWVITEAKGRNMPLDIDVVDTGNIVIVDTADGPRARVFGAGVTPDVPGPRRTSHHATCPERSRKRKGGRADAHHAAQRRRRQRAGWRR